MAREVIPSVPHWRRASRVSPRADDRPGHDHRQMVPMALGLGDGGETKRPLGAQSSGIAFPPRCRRCFLSRHSSAFCRIKTSCSRAGAIGPGTELTYDSNLEDIRQTGSQAVPSSEGQTEHVFAQTLAGAGNCGHRSGALLARASGLGSRRALP